MIIRGNVGEGGSHGLEARATGAAAPYPLPHAPSPNPLCGFNRPGKSGLKAPPFPAP
jgi:hypothetical protein